VAEVSSGVFLGMALTTTGTIWTWGEGISGGLGNGTNATSTVPVQVTLACAVGTAVPEVALVPEMTVGPNPTTGQVAVHTPFTSPLPVRITDLQGRTVQATTITHQHASVDLSALRPGLYLLNALSPVGPHVLQVVKE